MVRIIFTGVTGLLGGYFIKNKIQNYEIIGVVNKNIFRESKNLIRADITDKKSISELINKIKPQIIVHAAAISDVDYCENHPDEAYSVNVEGTRNIIEAAKLVNSKIVFFSSNAIYDGQNPSYDEESNPNPMDVYGKTKVEGENLVLKSGISYIILRLMTMYGWPQPGGRKNPVTWTIEELRKGERINVVNDIYNNHLYAGQAAEVIWKIIESNIEGEKFNIAGKDCISRFDLALKAAKIFELDSTLISPVDSDFFKNLAKRPKNTCFNVSKMEKELNIKALEISEGLHILKKEEKND